MVHEVKEVIVQFLDAIVKVAHTAVDTECAQKLQTFFAIFWRRGDPGTLYQLAFMQ
jgi:hypothetical protein